MIKKSSPPDFRHSFVDKGKRLDGFATQAAPRKAKMRPGKILGTGYVASN
jgi:hypothetical protein